MSSARGRSRCTGNIPQTSFVEGSVLTALDGTQWTVSTVGNTNTGRRAHQNIVREVPGPTPYTKRHLADDSLASAWRLLIDNNVLKHIKNCTETEARSRLNDDTWSMTLDELEAFLGIWYVRGASGAKGLAVKSLWSTKWGLPLCKMAMARNRFLEILKYLRFDIKSTRSERLKHDRFALISEVWNKFISNCQVCYTPGPYITIDEQLFPTKARCRFMQFMASKPDKYGQKFWVAVDKDKKYVVNAFPYLGKDDMRPDNQRLGDYIVERLMHPYLNKGRNVTCDNFFTSLKLAEQLKSKKTSLVGTVNRIRREIPIEVKKSRARLYDTQVLKKDDITLTVYQGKANKNVIVMSSLHPDVALGSDGKKKPETVTFYNETKYGVDIVDQMARKYSVKPPARRWPLHTFSNILDLAGINAWILYKEVTGKKIQRREYLLKLAEELTEGNIASRSSRNPALAAEEATGSEPETVKTRRKCQVRKSCKKDTKGVNTCRSCKKVTCKKCTGKELTVVTCVECLC